MIGEGEVLTVRVESLAAGGDGVCRPGSKVCFVPFAVPGDLLEVRVVKDGRRSARASIEKIVEASPHRRVPACPVFGTCGGCAWMHVAYDRQLEAKREILARALGTDDLEIFPSPRELGYRALARLHWDPTGPSLGFMKEGARSVVDIESCPVLEPALSECLGPLAKTLLPGVGGSAEVRLSSGMGGVVAAVEVGRIPGPGFYDLAREMIPSVLAGIAVDAEGIRGDLGDTRVVTAGPDGEEMAMPAGSFGQANRGVNDELTRTVASWVEEIDAGFVVELFAGAGNLSVLLAPRAGRLTTVELDERACGCASKNLAARGFAKVDVRRGEALEQYRLLAQKADVVVLDPPRTGHRDLARELSRGDHRRVIYVSCDPATLARDLALLGEGGYKPVRARGFDMFPQTPHVEAAVLLERG